MLARGGRSQRCQRLPAASPGTAGRPPSSPMALAAAAAGGARRMEKCESAPGASRASGHAEVLGRRSRSGATRVMGERGGMQALGCIDPAAKMPSKGESTQRNTVGTIIVTVFFLKLQATQRVALGSCFCVPRLDVCTMAGLKLSPSSPLLFLCKSSLQPVLPPEPPSFSLQSLFWPRAGNLG